MLIYTRSCSRSEITLPKDADRFLFTGLTREPKRLSNKTSEKSVLFYLIFSDKCSALKSFFLLSII